MEQLLSQGVPRQDVNGTIRDAATFILRAFPDLSIVTTYVA